MKNFLNLNKGFTLIELLVVISIIGLLASVILGNVRLARNKSRDNFLKEQALQMRTLMELQNNEVGSYAVFQPNAAWITKTADCDSYFGGSTYTTQARNICKAMVSQSSAPSWSSGVMLYMGNSISLSNNYSIMIALPYKDTVFCVGSSGGTSDTTSSLVWTNPGCYANP